MFLEIPLSSKKGKDFWGPKFWDILHIFAFCVRNPQNTELYSHILNLYTKLLPCEVCKSNLKLKLTKIPPSDYLTNPKNAFLYSYTLHDLVNQHVNEHFPHKPKKVSPPFEVAYQNYISKPLPIWDVLSILAVSYSSCQAKEMKEFVFVISQLLENCGSQIGTEMLKFLQSNPITVYLANSKDLFFYVYTFRRVITKEMYRFPDYASYYYSGMNETCDECKL